jgi:hypothetical protein
VLGQSKRVAVDHPCHPLSAAMVDAPFGLQMQSRDGG